MTNGSASPENKYLRKILAKMIPNTMPNAYTPNTTVPDHSGGKNAAAINVYTGKRAEQLINGVIKIVTIRSL